MVCLFPIRYSRKITSLLSQNVTRLLSRRESAPFPLFSSQPRFAPSSLAPSSLLNLEPFPFSHLVPMSEKLPILPVASSSQKPLSFRRTISSPLRATSLLALGGLAALTLTSLATSSRSICSRTSHSGKEDSLGAWIEKQAKISWWSLLDNV